MRNDTPLAVIWRRKWVVVITFLTFVIAAAIVSKSLQKVYSTESTLLIALPSEAQTFDAVQASQAVARSYADIIDSPNFAQLVANEMRDGTTKRELRKATSFEPVTETQLLKIKAEDPKPERAKRIADVYATTFVEYARTNLKKTTKAEVSVADRAPLSTQAARPKPTLYVLLASIVGLALGPGLAFARDRLDRRLRTSEDVESRFDKPILARVPRRGRSESSISAFKEAHRILRTNLQFATGGARLQSIAVTSGGEGEGKTTLVSQLAIASAEVGLRVLVVEGDFRRPTLQTEFLPGREPLRPGFSNYLVEAVPLDDVIYSTNRPSLDLVPAGPLPPSPSALLESRRGRTAVDDFLSRADLVIVDLPPTSIGADASVVSGWVDGVILVVDLERSTYQNVRDALRQLDAIQAPVLGIVINRDRRAEVSKYEYYSAAPSSGESRLAKLGSGRAAS